MEGTGVELTILLIQGGERCSIIKVKLWPEADCGTNHKLPMWEYETKLKNMPIKQSDSSKLDWHILCEDLAHLKIL